MKQNSKPKILILDANSSQCLPFISKLKSNFQIILVSRTLFSAGFFLSYKTTNKIWSKEYRSEETLFQKILEEVKKSDYKFVLSCSDRTSKILSENKKKFSEYTNL